MWAISVLDICHFLYATTLSKKQYATNSQNWPKSRVLYAKVRQLEKSTPQLWTISATAIICRSRMTRERWRRFWTHNKMKTVVFIGAYSKSRGSRLHSTFFKSPLNVSLKKKVQNDGFADDCWSDRWNQWEGFYRLGSPHLINPITSGCITLSLTALIFTHFPSFPGGEGLQWGESGGGGVLSVNPIPLESCKFPSS